MDAAELVADIADELGVSAAALDGLEQAPAAALQALLLAISAQRPLDASKIVSMLTSPDQALQRQGMSILTSLNDQDTWDDVISGCQMLHSSKEKKKRGRRIDGVFVSLKHRSCPGMLAAWAKYPWEDRSHYEFFITDPRGLHRNMWPKEWSVLLDGVNRRTLANFPDLAVPCNLSLASIYLDAQSLSQTRSIKSLRCHSSYVASLAGLQGNTTIEELSIKPEYGYCSPDQQDLGYLSGCSALQRLTLRSERIVNLDPLASCTALTHVEIIGSPKLESIDALVGLPKLKRIKIVGCKKLKSIPPELKSRLNHQV